MSAKERFLVTGGAGFIGSHLAAALSADGHFVRVLDDLSRGRRDSVVPGCEFIEGSLTDSELCHEACAGIDGVFHVAAAIDHPTGVDPLAHCMEQNVSGTQNILLAARDAGVRRLVYSASTTCYGGRPPPFSPAAVPECLTPYALSKYVGEQLCALFTRLYGLPTVSLRCADVYGARQPATGPYAYVLACFLEQHRAGKPLTIHGDGAQERDFVHVADVVDANLLAYRASASGLALNVGSGRSYSIKSVADLISSRQVNRPRPPGDVDRTLASIEETRDKIGWKPRIALEDGLRALMVQDGAA